jgi:multidrug efflux pump subunit AcrA (membrane-fusion protein)
MQFTLSLCGLRGRLFVLAASVVLLGMASGCNGPSATPPNRASDPETPEVKVVRPEKKDVRRLIERPGYNIEAYERTPLYARIAGYVQKWNVDMGDVDLLPFEKPVRLHGNRQRQKTLKKPGTVEN